MPRYDRTGPMGSGPGTGRGRGNCTQRSGFGGPRRGAMFPAGRPRGGFAGRCLDWWQGFWGQPANPAAEAEALKATLSKAKEDIAVMEARLAELEKKE